MELVQKPEILSQSLNFQVKRLIGEIETLGYESAPRGQKVREIVLQTLRIDPTFPLMDFESRPFNWKYFMGEIAWYMSRDNHVDFINNFSSFWNNIADGSGHVNSNYGKLLFGEQLQWVLDSLKADPNTRQAIAFVNQPKFQYEGNKDFVCTMYLNFWIRDNKLNMKVQMRSNDIFYGLTYDAPFFAFLQQTVWHWLKATYPDLQIGSYYHCADNIHYYERHFELAEEIKSENGKDPYFFLLREPLFFVKDGNYLITEHGRSFLTEVAGLIHSDEKITQENSRNILNNYFYIQ